MPVYYYHVIAFLAGFILDCFLGDPYFLPHPVRMIGRLISFLEKKFIGKKEPVRVEPEEGADKNEDGEEAEAAEQAMDPLIADEDWLEQKTEFKKASAETENVAPDPLMAAPVPEEIDWSQTPLRGPGANPVGEESGMADGEAEKEEERLEADAKPLTPEAKKKRGQGRTTVLLVLLLTVIVMDVVFMGSYQIHPILGCVVETILTYQILAAKCLYVESMKVYKALKTGTIEDARRAVSMIVGRDTKKLDEEGVARAAVETVAENTSDGVIAPMLCLAIGGPVLGMAYKAINTMDSMIGYKNERYLDFGRAAAKLDDFVNYLPSRISAWLMILSCHILGDPFIASEAKRIYRRDRRKHSSPNSAQTESVCAGALGIRLGGDSTYFGKLVHKPTIGDGRRKIDADDIALSNHLMYATTILCLLLCLAALLLVCQFAFGGMSVVTFGD